jgi:tetratricopeptide (TPR) repeat protein
MPMAFAVGALNEPKESKGFCIDRYNLLTNCVMVGLIVLGLVIEWKPLASLWYANLGDVSQTKLELSRYRFPEVLVEYVRRSGDYTIAESYWQQALALDPGNVSANQRWGELLLARGEYVRAAQLLEAAYARDPASPVTSQLLGAAYLGMGQMDNAYNYWVRLPDAVGRLESEAWVRYETNGDKVRAGWALALARRILDERLAQP